jgi:hypothetical protein
MYFMCITTALRLFIVAVLLLVTFANADGREAADFQCQLCRAFVGVLTTAPSSERAASATGLGETFTLTAEEVLRACRTSGAFDSCDFTAPALKRLLGARSLSEARALLAELGDDACGRMELCPVNEPWRTAPAADDSLDVRVALGHIHRGYGNLRVSVIDNNATKHDQAFLDFFEYNAPFKYVWTNKTLHTTVRPVTPGKASIWKAGTELTLNVTLPPQGKGVRGFLVADPCFSGEYVFCRYGETYEIFERLPKMLNAGLETDNDFWTLLGDNFYDPHGILGPKFFTQLTHAAKSKPIVSVAGNHDFWQYGYPTEKGYNTFGNGYMQYYLMDTAAAAAARNQTDGVPLNFTVNPAQPLNGSFQPAGNPFYGHQPPATNFFTLNAIGDVMMMSFSGAHTFEESQPLFDDACKVVSEQKPKWFIVLGHWSDGDAGCQPGMYAPAIHDYIITVDGCKEMADRIKWIEGHIHCNIVLKSNTGFRVAGFGMGDCANFGFPYLDTTGGQLEIGYFPIVGGNGTVTSNDEAAGANDVDFDTLLSCIQANGIGGCKRYAVTWMRQSYDPPSASTQLPSTDAIGGAALTALIIIAACTGVFITATVFLNWRSGHLRAVASVKFWTIVPRACAGGGVARSQKSSEPPLTMSDAMLNDDVPAAIRADELIREGITQ